MKRIGFLACAILLVMCGCKNEEEAKTVRIAVTGSPSSYSAFFEDGVKRAYEEVCEEYKDSGYEIICDFYDDKDNFETGEKITADLAKQEDLTAVISSVSPDITADQAYQLNNAGKVLVCPHWLYDNTLRENNYNMVFSTNISNEQVGCVIRTVAKSLPAKRWVVCASKDRISMEEANAFFNNKEMKVYDFCAPNILDTQFDRVTERWQALGVDGVILIPYDESDGFPLLFRLKDKMPDIYVVSDNVLDNQEIFHSNEEYFENVYFACSYFSQNLLERGLFADTMEAHGYLAFRMIVDTAVKNGTADPKKIAEILHKEGYDGIYEQYVFNPNGSVKPDKAHYYSFSKENRGLIITDIKESDDE